MLPTDRELMLAFQEGDELAFVSLYNRHKGPVYGFCLKMVLDEEMARDVLQETFLRVYENKDRLANAASFRTWLFTIARNLSLNHLRRRARTEPLHATSLGRTLPDEGALPGVRLEKSEQVRLVNHFLRQLKPEYREVLVLREYQNLSYEEIATVTRTTLSSVKSRLFKARRKLARCLTPYLEEEERRTRRATVGATKPPRGS